MRPHLEAIRGRLTGIFPTYIVDVPGGVTYPYFLVWSTSGDPSAEQAVDGVKRDLDTQVGVTAVGLTWESAAALLQRARDELCPGGAPGPLVVPGFRVLMDWLGSGRNLAADADVTVPGSNRHPIVGVDLYRLVSVPA